MVTKLVRSSCCAFVLLVACGYFQTAAWADGPQCETDPASCIGNPCDDDPDGCVDPDPGCDGAQSSITDGTIVGDSGSAKNATGRKKYSVSETSAFKRIIQTASQRKFIVDRLLSRVQSSNAPTQEDVKKLAATVGGGMPSAAADSCPDPDLWRNACRAMAQAILDAYMATCLTQYISDGFSIFITPEERAQRYQGGCVASATETYHNIMETCYAPR